jgi:hypothetical protein
MLGRAPAPVAACLIRLAEPLRGVALQVPATVRLRLAPPSSAGPPATLVDPVGLVRDLDWRIRAGT